MISKWKNNFLNLLKVGGLATAIALGGASLGVAVSINTKNIEVIITNESTISDEITNNDENTSAMKNPGILGLYGGFNLLNNSSLAKITRNRLIGQEILGISVGIHDNSDNINEITVKSDEKEVEILDLSKTMGNWEWISKQLKYPNKYTSKISMETLHKVEYNHKILFTLTQKVKTQFDNKQSGSCIVEVATQHVSAVEKQEKTPAKAESWNFVFKLREYDHSQSGLGTLATSMPEIPNSEVFKTALNEEAIINANFQILLWKKSGLAKPDGTDFDIAIMLNKKTGKVFIWAKTEIVIIRQAIQGIFPITIKL